MDDKNTFERMFGGMPPWMQRLIRSKGARAARGAGKHSRARTRRKDYWEHRKKRQKMAKASRRINR